MKIKDDRHLVNGTVKGRFPDAEQLFTVTILLIAMLLQSGCATVVVRSSRSEFDEKVYPATQLNVEVIDGLLHPGTSIFAERSVVGAGLNCLDIPFSMIFDTLFLPIDLICWCFEENSDP